MTSSGARGEKSIKRSSEQRKARPASRVRACVIVLITVPVPEAKTLAGGRSTAAAGRGRPILLPGRRTRGRDEQAKGRAKTLRRRHARAKAPGTCAHIPSLRRSPSPSALLSRSLAHSRSANPSVLRRFSSPSPGVRPFWRVTYRSPSLSSVKRSVGRPFLSSLLRRLSARGSPKVFAPHDGGAKQFFVGAEAACRACIGAVQ